MAWAGRLLQIAQKEGANVLDKGKDLTREYAVRALWGAVVPTGVVFKEEIVEMLRQVATSILQWLQHILVF